MDTYNLITKAANPFVRSRKPSLNREAILKIEKLGNYKIGKIEPNQKPQSNFYISSLVSG
jgi:hypothetical protein